MSSRGYGLHLETTRVVNFELGSTRAEQFAASFVGSELAVTLYTGPSMAEALSAYTKDVGRPPVPPTWAFGPWLSSDHWRDGGEVRYVVERYRELALPGSVFVFDSPWETSYNDFVWNTTQFAAGGVYGGRHYDGFSKPEEMLNFLDKNGFKVVLWMTPFVNVWSNDEGVPGQILGKSPLYDLCAERGYFVRASKGGPPLIVPWWKGSGSPIDFTNPEARVFFQERLRKLARDSGGVIAGWKTDDGESNFIPEYATYFDGRTGLDMKNGYSVAYHKAIWEVLGTDGMLLSRSGSTGSQAFPAHWSGDNESNFGRDNGLPSVVVAGLSAGLSGFSLWGNDVGGYLENDHVSGTPDELFIRWSQFGALSPIMQIHRQIKNDRQYPWSYSTAALDAYRRYANLHTMLFPYFYGAARESAATGLPILRHPALLHPTDPQALAANDWYYLGPDLLVAPVISNERDGRTVYLPAGTWFDFATGQRREGGASFEWTSLELPLFVRGGAILPLLAQPVRSIASAIPDELRLRIYPSTGPQSLTLFDNSQIEVTGGAVTISGPARTYQLAFYGDSGFTEATYVHPGGKRVYAGAIAELPESPSGGGCQTSPTGPALLLLAAALLLGRRAQAKLPDAP